MAPKTKPVASSSSATAPETQMGGSSLQEAGAPITGKKEWLSLLKNSKSFFNS